MKSVSFLVSLIILISIAPAFCQEHEQHQHAAEELGDVHFAISCKPEVQADFDRAVALLHSFWYAESEKAFQAIAAKDPECGMAYWGVAMSNYHPLWAPPTPAELERGKAAAQKAGAVGAKTDREKEWIAAIQLFYTDSDKTDHRTRSLAYMGAMETIHTHYPDEIEASAFYGLALLGTAQPGDKTYATQKKAAAILNTLVERAPQHPGVTHYIIHSFDYPSLAELALPAARSYSKIAASSPHALHMPSHIFTRLGLWQESIDSNLASAALAKAHVQETDPTSGAFDQLHAMDYLTYAYLQLGRYDSARKVMDEALAMPKVDQETFSAAYAFSAIPARYAIERHKWDEAAALEVLPTWFPWAKFPYAEANIHFARAIGAARSGKLDEARQAERKLLELKTALIDKDKYWADEVEIQRLQAAAWIAFAEGKSKAALDLMQASVTLEDSTEKHPVTPGQIIPAHEDLAELYLATKQPAEALAEFEKSLKTAPNRLNALQGAENAAKLAGNESGSKEYHARVVSLRGETQ